MLTFASESQKQGALAHLARAFDWQSRGGEFESRMLHKTIKDATMWHPFLVYLKKRRFGDVISREIATFVADNNREYTKRQL